MGAVSSAAATDTGKWPGLWRTGDRPSVPFDRAGGQTAETSFLNSLLAKIVGPVRAFMTLWMPDREWEE